MLKPILTLFGTLSIISSFSQFLPPQRYSEGTLGNYGSNAILGDVNGDANDDLVATSNGFVKVLLANETSFGEEVILPYTAFPEFEANGYFNLRDMDVDGDLDIVNGYGWIENEALTFNETHPFGSAGLSSLLTLGTFTGDLNGDGAEDVILPSVLNDGIYSYKAIVLMNDGAGNFPDSNIEILFNAQLNDGWLADADNDQDLDFVSSYNSQIYLFVNDGDGNFSQNSTYAGMGTRVIFADFNADGLSDLFYPNGFNFTFRLNQGNYDFSDIQNVPVDNYTSWWSYGFRDDLQDYEGDGDVDVVYQTAGGDVYLLLNDGAGQFELCCIVSSAAGSTQGVDLWKDLNNDGLADCIRCNKYVSCALQNGEGEQLAFDIIGGGLEGYDTGVRLMDLDEDGNLDVVSTFSNGLGVYRNDGIGVLSDIDFAVAHTSVQTIGLDDINDDGINDLVGITSGGVSYFDGLGNGSFGSSDTMLSLTYGRTAGLADFNLDGQKDIAVIKLNNPFELSWYTYDAQNGAAGPFVLGTFNNDGNATSNGQINVLGSGDYNGDGHSDYSVTVGASLRIFHGDGNGNYTTIVPSRPIVNSELIAHTVGEVADFNGDGRDDILYISNNINSGAGYIGLIKYNGTTYTHQVISLQSGNWYSQANFFGHLDFDVDGDEDIVYSTDHSIVVLSNNGDGTMQNLYSTTLGLSNPNFGQIALGDMDQDGLADIVFGESASGQPFDMKYYKAFNNLDSPYQLRCHVFIDDNGNGLKDDGEAGFNNQQMYFGETWGYGFSNRDGDFTLFALPGEIAVSLDENIALWNATTPWNYTTVLSDETQTVDLYFGLQPNGYQPHVTGDIILNEGVCAGESSHWVSITNTGNTIISGYYTLSLDSLMYFVTANQLPQELGGNEFRWMYDSLYYGESIAVQFDAINPDYSYIGTSVYNSLISKITDANDDVIFVDSDVENFVVNCAYDPNMKEEENGWSDEGYILPDDRLHYTIHFQNTGTAAASYVRIEDELSADLDWSSMELLSSSHEFSAWIEADGTANFEFDNIVLPDSGSNYAGSMGYVTFLINPIAGLEPGTVIENGAAIYFDLNPPVITETISNTIFDCVNLSFQVPELLCENGLADVVSGRNDFETFTWYIDNVAAASGAATELNFDAEGEHLIRLEAVNPICALSHEITVNVGAMPQFETVTEDQTFCSENMVLSASGNGPVEWWLEGQSIGTGASIEIQSAGEYQAAIANACGITTAIISVGQGALPQFGYLSGTAVLCEESITLEAQGNGAIEWRLDGETVGLGTLLEVSSAGEYEVVVSTECGSASDLVSVLQGEMPIFESVSSDALLCDAPIIIEAQGNGSAEWLLDGQSVGQGTSLEVSTAGNYEIVLSNACGMVSEIISVEQGALPAFEFISEGLLLCEETATLVATGNGGVEWMLDGQVVGVGSTLEVSSDGVYEAVITNDCGVVSELISITPGTAPAFDFLSENTMICDEPLILEASGNGEITWLFNGAEVATGNSVLAEVPGTYTALLDNACGFSEHVFDVDLGELPMFTSTIGEQKMTCEETVTIYAFADLPVSWYYDSEWVGDGNALLVEETGVYQAVISNGCFENAIDFNVEFLPTPTLEVLTDGPYEFCAGDSLVIALETNATNTFWLTSNGGLSDVFNYTFYESDNIQITVNDEICDTTVYMNITVYENPLVELIVSGDGLSIEANAGFETYAWTVDGVLQTAYTSNSIPVSIGEDYQLVVTDDNGCIGTNALQYDSVFENETNSLKVYPNPTSGLVTLKTSHISPNQPVLIYNAQGELVWSEINDDERITRLDLSMLATGVYSLRMGTSVCMLVIQK